MQILPRHQCLTTTSKQFEIHWAQGGSDPGEGITDNQAEAWGDDRDCRRALSGMEAELYSSMN